MIVTKDNITVVLRELKEAKRLAIDSETQGLRPYGGKHKPFSIVIASSAEKAFYFNFNLAPDIPEEAILTQTHAQGLKRLLSNPVTQLYLHNAKFDMAMLETVDIQLEGKIHDTMVTERLLNNTAISISLDNCVKQLGHNKDDKVSEYIKKHKLHTDSIHGHKEIRDLHYDKVPFELIVPYAEQDVKLTFMLAENQKERLVHKTKAFQEIYINEFKLLRTVYEMEKRGVMINRDYCERAVEHETRLMNTFKADFQIQTGKEFIDSSALFLEIFKNEEITFGEETATGQRNPRFDNYALEGFKSPIAQHILSYRAAKKRRDFYENFSFYGGPNGVLHAGFNQAGTQTGRFSAWEPNLQQLKKDEGEDLQQEFIVRRAIVPRPDHMFLMLDYNQVEYRLMLDQARAYSLITKINNEGIDVHQATADLAGITRKDAKTINFAIIYGAGIKKIAKSLAVSEDEAKRLKYAVLNSAPEIQKFIRTVMDRAKRNGILYNWYGREYKFENPQFAYRGPNHIIQGGAADIMKIAMNKIHNYLADRQSKIVMTIHDELVIELHEKEKHLVPRLKRIMEEVYAPVAGLPMTCSVEYSRENLADKKKLVDNGEV